MVDAVLAASPADELDWIEWKRSLELSGKTVRGILARHILGTANRLPEQAAAHADGRSFVVVGAEPGNRCGVAAGDPADLSQGLDSFLGPDRRRGRCTMTIAMACRSSCCRWRHRSRVRPTRSTTPAAGGARNSST